MSDENGLLVDALGSAVFHGGNQLSDIPRILKRVLAEGAWQDFETRLGARVHHDRFADFVTAQPLAGLGSTVDFIKDVIRSDVEAVDLVDQALQNPVGHPTDNNIIDKAPQGTSQDRALRKLRADAPELHADVLAGRLSAHAAMVQAGFRPKTFTLSTSAKPDRIAATLRRELDPETLAAVAADLREVLL